MARNKRPQGLEGKQPTPDVLKPSIDKAHRRTLKRDHVPIVTHKWTKDGNLAWDWPFEDDKDWRWLVFDAFGTRDGNVAAIFIQQLSDLSAKMWNEEHQSWHPDDCELGAMLAIVSANRPRNEAEAAMAAQMAAVHLMTMRVAGRLGEHPWDTKMIGAFSRLARTYANQMETMQVVKGKKRPSKQKIVVRQEKHIHQHVHLEGGADNFGSQAHETRNAPVSKNGRPLSGTDQIGQVVQLPGCQGQAGLSQARRGKGDRGTQG